MDNTNKLLNGDSSFGEDLDEATALFAPEEADEDRDFDGDEEDSGDDCDYGDEDRFDDMDGDHESALESVYGPNDGLFEDCDEDGGFDD